ncbi:MAG TPA: type IV toxin-antitoxin system AbiEi family antitoxin domain-containing protein [Phycisphaerae bacterium]|nr:type IV toxin-antitoxin system AbiEi family antitoxin domain-containing protein [Azonexus sp.]HPD29137.1 type IV toxin-antitoxin system AbiEi family antitoxin domain-containing protein [Phycisphaerae bacterium]HRR85999.1 type IV toxin-antitoxin system AbiEi family antitoxin domain-containing protein [Phycisphaerae bacterium]
MKTKLGPLETRLLAYAQMRRLQVVRGGELAEPLHLSAQQEMRLLSRLVRAGIIARVRRGLYLLPPRLPLGGKWSPSEVLALSTLMRDRQGRYQICGPSAFSRYGFEQQIPTRTYAYNNRLSGDRRIGATSFTLIKVADERLGSTEEVPVDEGLTAVYSSRVRTLVDAVYDWSRFDSLPQGYDWIRRELASRRVGAKQLVAVTLRYGNQATLRRVGALLEREGISGRLLARLRRALRPSQCLIPWVPSRPKRGRTDQQWGVVFND